MSSGMSNQSNPEQEIMGLMEDLSEMLRVEVLPTHLPLVQLIYKLCEDPTLKQVDLYSKYTRLAAVVGGDWITVKEELQNATRFGAPAFYCSISAMLAVFTCRRSRSHDELVSSLTELYNHVSAGNEALNKQIENALTTMGKQVEHAGIAEARIANIVKQAENALTTIGKQVNNAEVSIANIIERADNAINSTGNPIKRNNESEPMPPQTASQSLREEFRQDNVDAVPYPGATYRCKYGTLTINDKYQCVFNGGSLEAKKLTAWFILPVVFDNLTTLLNYDHEMLIKKTTQELTLMQTLNDMYIQNQIRFYLCDKFSCCDFKYKAGQWSYIC